MEIYRDNKWGTVCDDSWDIRDAQVVCKELLLGDAREAVLSGRLGRGEDRQPIWLSNVRLIFMELKIIIIILYLLITHLKISMRLQKYYIHIYIL